MFKSLKSTLSNLKASTIGFAISSQKSRIIQRRIRLFGYIPTRAEHILAYKTKCDWSRMYLFFAAIIIVPELVVAAIGANNSKSSGFVMRKIHGFVADLDFIPLCFKTKSAIVSCFALKVVKILC